MLEKSYRRMINFDLDTNELLKVFTDTRKPYGDIKKFFEDNGFEHSQYSGYTSKEKLSNAEMLDIMTRLSQKFYWLETCLQNITATNIYKSSDFTNYVIDECKNTISDQVWQDDIENNTVRKRRR